MARRVRRVAIVLDLQWLYKRHAGIFAGTQQYAKAHGWESIIDEFPIASLPKRRMKPLPFDGIIARTNQRLAKLARQLNLPLVNVWPSSPARRWVAGVYPDSTAIGHLFAEHLLARGFRRFATLTAPNNCDHQMEVAEFARIVQAAGFSCLSAQIPQNPQRDLRHWRKTVRQSGDWMDRWHLPIGVYVGGEGIGRMIVQECHRRGWRVPADVAIIAGKNEEILCDNPRPSLTSVEIGYQRIGYEAARVLDCMMNGEPAPAKPILLPPQGLVVRESTDFFAVDDDLVATALRFISTNAHKPIGPDIVARTVGAETRTLQNRFGKVLGRPIATEIRRVRLERAKRELTQGNRSLSEIARDVGIGEGIRMCEVFRRELGVTPTAYRKLRQMENR